MKKAPTSPSLPLHSPKPANSAVDGTVPPYPHSLLALNLHAPFEVRSVGIWGEVKVEFENGIRVRVKAGTSSASNHVFAPCFRASPSLSPFQTHANTHTQTHARNPYKMSLPRILFPTRPVRPCPDTSAAKTRTRFCFC